MSFRFKFAAYGFLMFVATVVSGCAASVGSISVKLKPAPSVLSDDLDSESLREAIRHSLVYLQRFRRIASLAKQPRRFTVRDVSDSLVAFEKLPPSLELP